MNNCEFCLEDFKYEEFKRHKGNCGHELIKCDKCEMTIHRRRLNVHLLDDCKKRTVNCKFCDKLCIADEIVVHKAICPKYPVPCPNNCKDSSKLLREDLNFHLKSICAVLFIPCDFVDTGCEFKGTTDEILKHCTESTVHHLQLTQNKLSFLSLLNCSGLLIWKISDWSAKMANANNIPILYSPSFYTTQYGYKLRASLYLNGDGQGKGTYISLFFQIMPGEYDAIQSWPFNCNAKCTLLDQKPNEHDKKNVVKVIEAKANGSDNMQCLQQPERIPNRGYGCSKFISHTCINTEKYIKDDVVFIKFEIEKQFGINENRIESSELFESIVLIKQ